MRKRRLGEREMGIDNGATRLTDERKETERKGTKEKNTHKTCGRLVPTYPRSALFFSSLCLLRFIRPVHVLAGFSTIARGMVARRTQIDVFRLAAVPSRVISGL